jgi:hypothetical protein
MLPQQSKLSQGKICEETILHGADVGSPNEELVADQMGIGRRMAQSPAKKRRETHEMAPD